MTPLLKPIIMNLDNQSLLKGEAISVSTIY